MSQGIGVRYTASGVRVLGLEQLDEGVKIVGIAAGTPGESLESFIIEHGFSLDDSVIVGGLCPGDFLSAFITRSGDMDTEDVQKHLRWEIKRKIISEPFEYFVDFAMTDTMGFVFASRKNLTNKLKEMLGNVMTDVEPVALYNGCEISGETGGSSVLLLSIEAEGISSVLLQEGSVRAMDSFPVREDELLPVLAGLDIEAMKQIDSSATERFSDYVLESINRISSYCEAEKIAVPEHIVVAGGGVYIGDFASIIEQKSSIHTTVSNPFTILQDDIKAQQPDLAEMSAAFTTCLGFAIRALE